jgi:hypothetical protein
MGGFFISTHSRAKTARAWGPGEKNVSKQEVITTIVECAARLGFVPSLPRLTRESSVSRRQVRRYFGSYARALAECNLSRKGAGYKVEMEELFRDWAGIVRQIGKLPSVAEYESLSQYSPTPLMARFGVWSHVPGCMKDYREAQGGAEEWSDVLGLVEAQRKEETEKARMTGTPNGPGRVSAMLVNQPIYGPLMRPYPLAHGPVNEAGVIFLFGALAEKLGYVVTRIQSGYPDCEAMRRIEGDRWQRVRIEIEYESRNFVKHMHDASQCDLIVCWTHNWPECPLEVLELEKEAYR